MHLRGRAQWVPGELEKEIASGVWHVAEPDPSLVFRQDTSGMWEELVKRLGNGHPPQRGGGYI